MKYILILLLSLSLVSCSFDTKKEGVEKIRIGMDVKTACCHLNISVDEWDDFDSPKTYAYGTNYYNGSGRKRTFWMYVVDGKVTRFTSI
jgi:hypothetical protein